MALTQISTAGVKDDAVTSAKIPANAVGSSEIQDGNVIAAKLATSAVQTAKIADDAVTNAKIADAAIDSEHFVAGSIDTAHIADQAVTLTKLPHGTSSNDGKFLRANNGADPTFETVSSDVVNDTSPQLGGDLASNGNDIRFADGDRAFFGTGSDLQIFHNGTNSFITDSGTGDLYFRGDNSFIVQSSTGENKLKATSDGAVLLYHDDVKKFETTSSGATVTGTLNASNTSITTQMYMPDNGSIRLGNSDDLQLYHDANNSWITDEGTGSLKIRSVAGSVQILGTSSNHNMGVFTVGGAAELYHNNSKKFETTSSGIHLGGANSELSFLGTGTCDHSIASPSGTNDVVVTANKDAENVTSNIIFKSSGSGGGSVSTKLQIHSNGNVTRPHQAAMSFYNAVDRPNLTTSHNSDPIEFSSQYLNNGGMSGSNSNSRITVPTTGTYLVSGMVAGSGNGSAVTDGMQLIAFKNGSISIGADTAWPLSATAVQSGAEWTMAFTVLVNASANDYFELCMTNIDTNNAVSMDRGYFNVSLYY